VAKIASVELLWEVRRAADAILDFVAGIDMRTYAETRET